MAGAISGFAAKEVQQNVTDKHRNVMRKLVVEAGWLQRRMYDTGWSDVEKSRGCTREESTEKHRLSVMEGSLKPDPRRTGKMEQRTKTSEEEGGITSHLHLEEKPLVGPLVESESTKAGECELKAFVTMSPPMGSPGRWCACGWSVVQLDHDEEMGPQHGMYGTLDVEPGAERAIKRAELAAREDASGTSQNEYEELKGVWCDPIEAMLR